MRLKWLGLGAAALPLVTACSSFTPQAEPHGLDGPAMVLRHAGRVVAQSGDHRLPRSGHRCPAGNWLDEDRVVITGGFPAAFDLEVRSLPGLVAAEVSVAGGTLTNLGPGAKRSTSVRDGQTVETARKPLSGSGGGDHLRFSVIPLTGTRAGGPQTVQVYTRILDEDGGATPLGTITAGSEARLCGPY